MSVKTSNIIPALDVPYYYEFLLDGTVPKEAKGSVMDLLDRKLIAAKRFLDYLNTIDPSNGHEMFNEQYDMVQNELSAPIVDGRIFAKLNQDFNHTTYEVEDTRNMKKRIGEESNKAQTVAETSKRRFQDAMKSLEVKAGQINYSNIGAIPYIKEDALRYHFEKVCAWILDIYYDTPASKFEWDNFKKNVFIADKGADFQKRIKGLYVPKLYDYQIEICQYISSTRPLFKSKLNNNDLDVLLSTSEDVIVAFNARQEYTAAKKTIAFNRSKDIEYGIDLAQSEKVSKTTHPYIDNIYNKLIMNELTFRGNNLVDFNPHNRGQHLFFKGKEGKITTFMRGDALANYGEEPIEEDKKKPGKPGDKKPVDNKKPEGNKSPEMKPSQPLGPKDIRIAETEASAQPRVQTSPIGRANKDEIEFDDSFEMGRID